MREEWKLEATIENQVNDTYYPHPITINGERKGLEGGCVCAAFTHCYPEHTLTLTCYHKEKRVAFCYLSLSGPPGDLRHTH